MDRKISQLQSQERAELEAQLHTQATPPGSAFESVDELLRHDAAQTALPPQLEARLAESIENTPPPARSWWQRLLGSS